MTRRGVSLKLLCLVGVSIVAFVGLGVYGISNTTSTFEWVDEVHSTAADFSSSTREITNPLSELRQLSLSIVMAPNPKIRDELDAKQEELTNVLDASFQRWTISNEDRAEAEAFSRLQASWERYKTIKDFTISKARDRYREEAFINAIGAEQEQFDDVNACLTDWMQIKIDNSDDVYREATKQNLRVLWV